MACRSLLHNSDGKELGHSDRLEKISEPTIARYQLKIRGLRLPIDYGEYSVEASNGSGKIKSSCLLVPAGINYLMFPFFMEFSLVIWLETVIPEKPSAPKFLRYDCRSLLVTWDPPTNCAPVPVWYILQCRISSK